MLVGYNLIWHCSPASRLALYCYSFSPSADTVVNATLVSMGTDDCG